MLPEHREEIPQRTVAVLNRGNARNPDVLLLDLDGQRVVFKDFAPRSPWVRATVGRWATACEVRAYHALRDHPAVPRYLGRLDALAFFVEYRPGERMSRRLRGRLRPDFGDRLEEAVRAMHARGVAHLDLRHRSNILVDQAGSPVLIDFASAVCVRPGGWLHRTLLPWLARLDLSAVHKWRQRLGLPDATSDVGTSLRRRGARRPT